MRTPLSRVRGLGTAKSGTGNFIVERLTSFVLLLLTPYVLGFLIFLAGRPRDFVLPWLGSMYLAPALAAFLVVSIIHMRIGMQVIIEDYVHNFFWKIGSLLANWIFCWSLAVLSLYAILKIALAQS